MEVIPAIDLKGGKCVRLYQGDFQQAEVYADDPVAVAQRFEAEGARRLHVVDLDATITGAPVHMQQYGSITSESNVKIQVGGGIRDSKTATAILALGVNRIVLGTSAVENPKLIRDLCKKFGSDTLIVSLDARDGKVAIRGWRQVTQVPVVELLAQITALGVRRFVYTDIARDGTLSEPNFSAVGMIVRAAEKASATVIGSGGISSVEHIKRLGNLGLEGAIIGRSLYTGDLDLGEALVAAS